MPASKSIKRTRKEHVELDFVEVELLEGWKIVQIGNIVEINVSLNNGTLSDDTLVSFIPMRCVEEESGRFQPLEDRKFGDVKKGYTAMRDGDVIFAKVTPCMENGKAAVVNGLTNGVGFGSTEFYTLSPKPNLLPEFLFYFIIQQRFRREAERHMTGAVGLRRVPKAFIENYEIPLPPLPEQRRIVARIEELFSHLDAGVAALRHAKAQLQRYRQSVLAAAVTGELTKGWREQHPDVEPAEELMKRVLKQRREQWNGRGKYTEPSSIGETPRVSLPECWKWCSLDTVSSAIGGFAFKSKEYTDSGYQIVKMGNVRMHRFELENNPSFIESVPPDIVEKYLLRRDDLVITLTGTRKKRDYGFVARVREEQNLLLNQRIALIRPCSLIDAGFLLLALSAEYFRDQFFAGETGNVGQGNVSMKAVTASAFALPPLAEQQQIVSEVEARTTAIDHLESELDRQITRSSRLRQSTLASAFAGNLIPNA